MTKKKDETIRIPTRMVFAIDRKAARHGDVVLETEHVEYVEVPMDAFFERGRAMLETIARQRGDRENAALLTRDEIDG